MKFGKELLGKLSKGVAIEADGGTDTGTLVCHVGGLADCDSRSLGCDGAATTADARATPAVLMVLM